MDGFQMPLFDVGEVVPSDEALQASRMLSGAYEEARKYGHVAASKCNSYNELELWLNGFADGMTVAYSLNAAEREMVRNFAFSTADAVMQSKQH